VVESHLLRAQAISDIVSEFLWITGKLFLGLKSWASKQTEHQPLREKLNHYSDRELSEIGISRVDIKDISGVNCGSCRSSFDITNIKILKQPNVVEEQKQKHKTSIAA